MKKDFVLKSAKGGRTNDPTMRLKDLSTITGESVSKIAAMQHNSATAPKPRLTIRPAAGGGVPANYYSCAELIAWYNSLPGRHVDAVAQHDIAAHGALAGIELYHIPYKGGAPALQDLMGGQIDALADSSSWAPHVQSGRLRLLATWGATRTQAFPQVPTLRDAGFDVVVDAPNGVGAPRGLAPEIEMRLREAFRVATASPEFAAACARIDAPVVYLDGPDYEKYASAVYKKEAQLIERLKLKELMAKN